MIFGVSSASAMRQSQAMSSLHSASAVEPVRKIAPRPTPVEEPVEGQRGQQAAVVSISPEARALAQGASAKVAGDGDAEAGAAGQGALRAEDAESEGAGELTEAEQEEVQELQARDAEVRAHEQAHKAVGGQYAGAIHYDTQRGPDGASYAVGGHVNISTSEVPNDPQATVAKMQQVVRAALAPAEPSSADRAVAASANGKAAEARREMAEETSEAMKAAGPNAEAEPGALASSPSAAPAEESGASVRSRSSTSFADLAKSFGVGTSNESPRAAA